MSLPNKYTVASKNSIISIAPSGKEIIQFTINGSILTPTTRNPSPVLGELYIDSSDNNFYYWDGSVWNKLNNNETGFILVNKPGHSYTTGQAVYFDGYDWLLAQSDSYLTLGQAVVEVIDSNYFKAIFTGVVEG